MEHTMTWLEFIERLGPTLVGLLALWIAYVTATRQIRATTVSASRQQWVDSLTEMVSEYLGLIQLLSDESSSLSSTQLYQLTLLNFRISIMLRMDNTDHKRLWTAMSESLSIARCEEPADSLANACQEVVLAAQHVVDAEWSRIKQGE